MSPTLALGSGPYLTRARKERFAPASAGNAYVDAPALIDLEFLSAARGLLARRLVTRGAAEESIERFLTAPIDRHAHGPLPWRAWELRANLTLYDAAYVALAEMLVTALLTVDRRLARTPMIRCSVELAGI